MKIINRTIVLVILFFGIQDVLLSQGDCTSDSSVGNLDATNLTVSPGGTIRSCAKSKVTAEWQSLTNHDQGFDADVHSARLFLSLPNQFDGLSGELVVKATGGAIYWDVGGITQSANEVMVPLEGLIPSTTIITIEISGMDVSLEDDNNIVESIYISQSIANLQSDCHPFDDEQSITSNVLLANGPTLTSLTADCSGSESFTLGGEITPGGSGEYTYEWSGPDGFTSTEPMPTISGILTAADRASKSGDYTLIITDGNVCQSELTETFDGTNCFTLPVSLLNFTADSRGLDGELSWVTASEVDNDRFEIERSLDGKRFEKIGEVKGNGTTTSKQSYSYTDKGIGTQVNGRVYYRLNQVDYDGSSEASEVRYISFGKGGMTVYPNPTTGSLRIEVPVSTSVVKVYNSVCELVKQSNHNSDDAFELSELVDGVYNIRVEDERGEEIGTERIVKIK